MTLQLWTKLAELAVSIDFKRWNLGFHNLQGPAIGLHHQHQVTASLDQVGRAVSLNQVQGLGPGVSQAARTSNWLAIITKRSLGLQHLSQRQEVELGVSQQQGPGVVRCHIAKEWNQGFHKLH